MPTSELERVKAKVLFNKAVQQIVEGPLGWSTLSLGGTYQFDPVVWPIRNLSETELTALSLKHQLSLSPTEMRTIQAHFVELGRDPTDAELETIAQTWSEHCSHKTLGGRVHYVDESRDIRFTSMLKETIFAATKTLRARMGATTGASACSRTTRGSSNSTTPTTSASRSRPTTVPPPSSLTAARTPVWGA